MQQLSIQPPQPFAPQLKGVQQIYPYPSSTTSHYNDTSKEPSLPRDSSPHRPEYSPITPKTDAAVLAITNESQQHQEQHPPILRTASNTVVAPTAIVDPSTQPSIQQQDVKTDAAAISAISTTTQSIAPTVYIPPPPSQPFSSDDSIDGLALRAAISSLQFQRQKAKQDIKSLEQTKKLALANPDLFTKELVAGRLKEKRHDFGCAEDVVDAQRDEQNEEEKEDEERVDKVAAFDSLPGAQNVVRMPHINWDKYNILSEPLEALHDQQRRWPGSAPFQQDRTSREFAVAAPYSPFEDSVDGQSKNHARNASDGSRKDSNPVVPVNMATPAIEHNYETRRNSRYQAQ